MNKMSSHLTHWTLVVFILSTWTICRGQGSYWGNKTCPRCTGGGTFCINPGGECTSCTADQQRSEPVCVTQCESGRYGRDCQRRCGQCLEGTTCDPYTGRCHEGCKAGYIGGLCDEECPPGTYGDRCQQRCGHCRKAEACDHSNGACSSGCDPGYSGELCDLECDFWRWGYSCNETCGNCADNTTCLKEDGICPQGCEGDFLMPLCREPKTCSCADIMKIAVYTLSTALAIALVLFLVALCVFCNRHRHSKKHLRAIRQETKLNEVHRQLKETLVCNSYLQTDSSSAPRPNCGISSFTHGQDSSHRDSRDNGACNRTSEVSEATPDYQNVSWAGLERTPGAGSSGHSREEQYLDMNGPRWSCRGGARGGGGGGRSGGKGRRTGSSGKGRRTGSDGNGRRAGGGDRGSHASRARLGSDQEEIYINEF